MSLPGLFWEVEASIISGSRSSCFLLIIHYQKFHTSSFSWKKAEPEESRFISGFFNIFPFYENLGISWPSDVIFKPIAYLFWNASILKNKWPKNKFSVAKGLKKRSIFQQSYIIIHKVVLIMNNNSKSTCWIIHLLNQTIFIIRDVWLPSLTPCDYRQ